MTEDAQSNSVKDTEFDERPFREGLTAREQMVFELGKIAGKASPETQEAIYKDELTGLPNRRWFLEKLRKTLGENQNLPNIVVAEIDLNGFKRLNDTMGHSEGDRYLKFFAGFLEMELRRRSDVLASNVDFASRVGGDEFWLMVDLSQRERRKEELAVPFDRRVGSQLPREDEADMPTSREIRLHTFETWLRDAFEREAESAGWAGIGGFSIGVAFCDAARHAEDLMKLADAEMYKQKPQRER